MTVAVISIASVVLALITAGCIAYVAWDLTSEDRHATASKDDEQPDSVD